MANYSDDQKLRRYYPGIDSMGDNSERHDEAKREVDRRLRALMRDRGYSESVIDDYIDDLSTDTVADLVPVACYCVLEMYYSGLPGDENRESALFWRDKFERALRGLHIEYDSNADGTAEDTFRSGGRVFLA